MSKPVLVSDVPPLQRVVSETDAGVVVPAGETEGVVEAVTRLATDPTEARRLGTNGRDAAVGQWSWSNDAERLQEVYASV